MVGVGVDVGVGVGWKEKKRAEKISTMMAMRKYRAGGVRTITLN